MTLYMAPKTNRGFIEWEVPAIDTVETIGLWFDEEGNLTDYDGIMGYLPEQAINLIEGIGLKVDREEFAAE